LACSSASRTNSRYSFSSIYASVLSKAKRLAKVLKS
jgi:hypothetical protein